MISIVVPVYNAESYLRQCLDSLESQTYSDIEIICVNDGSTDGSLDILKQYAAKDARIKVVSQENQGPSETRNRGVDMAKGEWMMFVDSDDWLELNCCERIMSQSEACDLAIFSYTREFKTTSAPKYIFDQQPRIFENADIDWLYERLIAPNGTELRYPEKLDSLSTVWGKLYRTSIIKNNAIQFTSTKVTGTLEDLIFNRKYFNHLHRACYVPDCLYHYRKTKSDSMAYSYKPDLCNQWLQVFDEISNCADAMKHLWMPEALERRKALCIFGLGLNVVFSKKGWGQEYKMLNDIVCSDWYTRAIAKLDNTPMPLHWKCFYGSARHKQTRVVLLMLQIMNLIINR